MIFDDIFQAIVMVDEFEFDREFAPVKIKWEFAWSLYIFCGGGGRRGVGRASWETRASILERWSSSLSVTRFFFRFEMQLKRFFSTILAD